MAMAKQLTSLCVAALRMLTEVRHSRRLSARGFFGTWCTKLVNRDSVCGVQSLPSGIAGTSGAPPKPGRAAHHQ